MTKTVFKCPQQIDEMGEPESFTKDLFYVANVANAKDLSHLTVHGLPELGTEIRPGMILIGKLGAKKEYGTLRKMTDLEYYVLCEGEKYDELRAYWRQRIYDGSIYAPSRCAGTVVAAYFEIDGKEREYRPYEPALGTAVVEIENP
jgi:hypothetical protein